MESTPRWAVAVVVGAVCVMVCVLVIAANGTSTPTTWAYSPYTGEMTLQPPLLAPEQEEYSYLPYILLITFRSPLYFPCISRNASSSSLLTPEVWAHPKFIGK